MFISLLLLCWGFMGRHCLVDAAPEYLMELCLPVGSAVGRQSLRSASRGDLVVPRFRLQTFGHRAFTVSGPQIWNSLPLRIRQSIAFQTETESASVSAVLSASVDPYLMKGLLSFLYYYYYYYYFVYGIQGRFAYGTALCE